jgi:hypothetical protein
MMLSVQLGQRGQESKLNIPLFFRSILVGREFLQAVQQKNLNFSGAGSFHNHCQEDNSLFVSLEIEFLTQE